MSQHSIVSIAFIIVKNETIVKMLRRLFKKKLQLKKFCESSPKLAIFLFQKCSKGIEEKNEKDTVASTASEYPLANFQLVGISQTLMERRRRMANRKRNIQMKFYVTEEEKRLIDEKMKLLPTQRYGAYLRKMAIDGYIIFTDTAAIKAFTKELSAIGRNINQIAKRVNAGDPAYQADMEEIRERLDEIWQLQRRILSSQR